ncbi:HAD family hydrolase [Natronomonas sp. EA1]|uniref:HAD family hydrolase n=1 Tax=Natronomonas sp. EA1 TaxID=3421655 RepID=UPI003EBC9629
MYDAVLFDIDDTLCAYRRSAGELLALAFDDVGVEPCFSVADYFERYGAYVDSTDSVNELRRACFADLASEAGHDAGIGRAIADAFAAERDHRDVVPLPGIGVLDSLSVPVGVVTNGAPDMQAQKLEGLGLADRFEVVVHAGYDTPAKPAPEGFHRACEALGVAPDRTVHVGNSLTSDVAGAHAAGVASAWIPTDEERIDDPDPRPHHTFGTLADLGTLY